MNHASMVWSRSIRVPLGSKAKGSFRSISMQKRVWAILSVVNSKACRRRDLILSY